MIWSAVRLSVSALFFGGVFAIATAANVDASEPASASSEAPVPSIDLFEGIRSGALSVSAEGSGNGRMVLSVKNRRSTALRVVLPPGLLVAGASGQFGGGGFGGAGGGGFGGAAVDWVASEEADSEEADSEEAGGRLGSRRHRRRKPGIRHAARLGGDAHSRASSSSTSPAITIAGISERSRSVAWAAVAWEAVGWAAAGWAAAGGSEGASARSHRPGWPRRWSVRGRPASCRPGWSAFRSPPQGRAW